MKGRERFLAAAGGAHVDRAPVWLMRQAGRYLPEYQALKAQHTFVERCIQPALATEISLQPWRRFGVDGVVVFCDILMPLSAMGLDFSVPEGGPIIQPAVSTLQAVKQLRMPDAAKAYGYLQETLGNLRHTVQDEAAVIGFSGAPWTVAMYMYAGGRLTHRERVKTALIQDTAFRDALFAKLVPMITDYLVAQTRAGADVVQLFDTWGGLLTANEYQEIAAPALRSIIQGVSSATQGKIPVTIYCNHASHLLDTLTTLGANVISIDWNTSLTAARKTVGTTHALQGNLDPETLLTDPATITKATQAMLAEGGRIGYIANLGHGVLKETPVEHVGAFVKAVQAS